MDVCHGCAGPSACAPWMRRSKHMRAMDAAAHGRSAVITVPIRCAWPVWCSGVVVASMRSMLLTACSSTQSELALEHASGSKAAARVAFPSAHGSASHPHQGVSHQPIDQHRIPTPHGASSCISTCSSCKWDVHRCDATFIRCRLHKPHD